MVDVEKPTTTTTPTQISPPKDSDAFYALPTSSYYFGPPISTSAFGEPVTGTPTIHLPKEIISPTAFGEIINDLNSALISAHNPTKTWIDNSAAILSFYLTSLVFGTHYQRLHNHPTVAPAHDVRPGGGRRGAIRPKERSDADREGRRSYAQLLASTFASVWSDHKAEGKAEVPKKIVCLGLGSPTSSRSAQVQLALLVVVRTYISLLPSSEREGDTEAVTLTSDPDNKASVKGKGKQTPTPNGAAVLNGERRERSHGEKGAVVDCVAYDPVFTPADIKLLARYGVRALAPYSTPSDSRSDPTTSNPSATPATNASASSIPSQAEKTVNQGTAVEEETIDWHYTKIRTPTLVYMPHCDRELYEYILSLNYPPSSTATAAASPTVLLSNILKNYTTFNSHLEETWPTLHRLIPQLRIVEVPNWQSGKPSALIPQEAQEQGGGEDEGRRERGLEVVGEFVKMWDKNALRDLGFHWL
ncbi:uncharacterized protein UBRO2_02152 [Ustilago bromivora]|uniref:SRR1-like domain-containing protein n=1 Tax=Ustilago bromivora TaxID=307758 RepID=A0A8H8QKH3_9BASI|nr:uncharacterized protein UBRO2_02152 [Ustilago bromivora]